MPKKCVLILLDGIGDRSYAQLDDQTPLQAANTPVLNELAEGGANGLYHAALLGQALPSENAHFAIFGYDMADFPGRGALEALGAGIAIAPQDVALLAHFACLTERNETLFLDTGKPEADDAEIADVVSNQAGNVVVANEQQVDRHVFAIADELVLALGQLQAASFQQVN